MPSLLTTLHKAAKAVYNEYKDKIEDIILLGSFMKGKEDPEDIDVLIIFKEQVDKPVESALKKALHLNNLDLNSITLQELEGDGFIAKEGVYLEGFSLLRNAPVSSRLGFYSVAFLCYNLSSLKGSARVRFYYALQGRGVAPGFLKTLQAARYSDNIILCAYGEIEKLKSFFEQWKIPYVTTPALIPKRLKQVLLGK
ncbi:nucleotidyltransferase domain-containing protein [Candidatus Woesearchaeota archaeon]|nr:nucleotidyltransferase domain-containing protein [Candidatus Woesearchaeota archaeon]